jgi:hypothetical protein
MAVIVWNCVMCGESHSSERSRLSRSGLTAVKSLTAPVTATPADFRAATESWRWLLPVASRPLLVTALGDVFVESPSGTIQFLDTESGELTVVANSRVEWQQALNNPANVDHWFRPDFVKQLKLHTSLTAGQVYSPTQPLILGGQLTVENYTPSIWQAHLHVMGQIHRQVKDLPSGTPITKVHITPW